MARSRSKRPGVRTLIWLVVLFVALVSVLGGGAIAGQASWAPKLALDLEGGTQMILSPKTTSGGAVNQDQLNQAVQIIPSGLTARVCPRRRSARNPGGTSS